MFYERHLLAESEIALSFRPSTIFTDEQIICEIVPKFGDKHLC